MTPAERYKRIVAELDDATGAVRERDRQRVDELGPLVKRRYSELMDAGNRAALTRAGVALCWDAAVEALWGERWFLLRPFPEPNRLAKAEHLNALDRAVEEALQALITTVRRRSLGLRRS